MPPSNPPPAPYSPLQQDRQARSRPTHQPAGSSANLLSTTFQFPSAVHPSQYRLDETFESRERRHNAAVYLESNEMLIWYAAQRNESVPQTRLHFEKILAGQESDSDSLEWVDDQGDYSSEDDTGNTAEADEAGKSKYRASPSSKQNAKSKSPKQGKRKDRKRKSGGSSGGASVAAG